MLAVCHVLRYLVPLPSSPRYLVPPGSSTSSSIVASTSPSRYFPPVVKIKELIESGVLGRVMTINHTENVGFWHFAHRLGLASLLNSDFLHDSYFLHIYDTLHNSYTMQSSDFLHISEFLHRSEILQSSDFLQL